MAIDETSAGWNTLEWIGRNAVDGDGVRLITVHERLGEGATRSEGRLTIARHLLAARRQSLDIETEAMDGPTLARLLSEARSADVLVIGGRRSDRLWGALTSRVAERVLAGASGPVVVVPETWRPTSASSVVVGVDGQSASRALELTADAVARRVGDLVLVRAWEPPTNVSPIGRVYLAREVPRGEHEGQLELDAAIRKVSRDHPDLRMRAELRQGRPADVLQRSAGAAALIAIGRHHRSALGGSLFGSVGEHLAQHSRVPILVVPPTGDALPAEV